MSPLEKVARAIAKSLVVSKAVQATEAGDPWAYGPAHVAAIAGLTALLDPDPNTVEAVCAELTGFSDDPLMRGAFWIGWRAALQHILKGAEG